jgi:hypothetical protein
MIDRECLNCNKIYLADPKRLKHGRQTSCSRKCSYELRSKKLSHQIECGNCGLKFNRPPSKIERIRHGKVFCSKECQYGARSKGLTPRIIETPYDVVRKTDAEKIEYRKKWKIQNQDTIRKQARDRARERRKTDPLYVLRNNISRSIRANLTNGYKSESTKKIIGCSIEELKLYLESKFTDGMSWYNYGKWHIDHITPISLARTNKEVYQLNHYTNFQPLWAEDNLKKSNKVFINHERFDKKNTE